jgi:hypothetical protein
LKNVAILNEFFFDGGPQGKIHFVKDSRILSRGTPLSAEVGTNFAEKRRLLGRYSPLSLVGEEIQRDVMPQAGAGTDYSVARGVPGCPLHGIQTGSEAHSIPDWSD